jgi:hypothetical protein
MFVDKPTKQEIPHPSPTVSAAKEELLRNTALKKAGQHSVIKNVFASVDDYDDELEEIQLANNSVKPKPPAAIKKPELQPQATVKPSPKQ